MLLPLSLVSLRRGLVPMVGILLSLASTGSVPAAEANLVENGNFSQFDAKGAPEAWQAGGKYEMTAASGGGLRVSVVQAGSGEGQIGQRVSLPPGHNVVLSGRLRSESPGMGFLQLKLFKGGKELQRVNVGRSGPDGKEVAQEIFVGEADRGEVLLRFFQTEQQVGKAVEFSDIRLVDKGEKVLLPPAITGLEVVPTFTSAGVSVALTGDPSDKFRGRVFWRKKGDDAWKRGLDLVWVPNESVCRGSLLGLEPATEYEVRCEIEDAGFSQELTAALAEKSFTTWSDSPPIAREVTLPPGEITEPLRISDQGTETGWIRYKGDPTNPTILNVPAGSAQAVLIEGAAFVLLENVTIRGGDGSCVEIQHSHDIRIRGCDIAGWGDKGTPQPGLKNGLYVDANGKVINLQAGVRINFNTTKIVVEDNFIHSPRGSANTWRYGHPNGPQGVIINTTEGNHVVRNNDIIGNERHWWNDAIESMHNERRNGGPYRDTDISGNVLAFSNDDGTELDGGQINVRYFDNWIQWAFCGVSCAPNMGGPSYVLRNLIVLGDERNKANYGFKIGGANLKDKGLPLIINNTVLSENSGFSTGQYGPGATPVFSRNNVFSSPVITLSPPMGKHYDMDYDLFRKGALLGGDESLEVHAVLAEPHFVDASRGDFRLVEGSPGTAAGVFLEGFHTGSPDQRPHMGAFQPGAEAGNFPTRKIAALPAWIQQEVRSGGPVPDAEVMLKFAPDAGSSWTAFSNADWLKVEAGPKKVSPSASVKLTIDPAGLAVGRHRAAVTFRTDKGYNRTVFVSLTVKPANPITLELEAEDASFGGNFVRKEDPSASGGAYVVPPYDPAKPTRYGKDEKHDSVVTFDFEVPEDGLYELRAHLMIPGPDALSKDSLFLSLDGGEPVFWGLVQAGNAVWNWQDLPGGKGPTGMAFELKKGPHTLRLIQREPGVQIDKIAISNEL
jgi:hypothetical protein